MSACSGVCDQNQFRIASLVIDCEGAWGSVPLDIKVGEDMLIAHPQEGTREISVRVSADFEINLALLDMDDNCILGPGCVVSQSCPGSDFCHFYRGLPMYYDGGSSTSKEIRLGLVPSEVRMVLRSSAAGVGSMTFEHQGLTACPLVLPGCRPCDWFSACTAPKYPQCSGGEEVSCETTFTTTTATATSTSTTTGSTTTTSVAASICAAGEYQAAPIPLPCN